MRFIIAVAVALASSAPAFATDGGLKSDVTLHRGQTVVDAASKRLGTVDSVANDGSIGLIVDAKYVRLPSADFTVVDGKIVSAKSKRELR
uniref:hypothetical protein n=1 Tax=uncultured Sphingomonas sp. TaxID=158754 RepID=UPI0035CB39B8